MTCGGCGAEHAAGLNFYVTVRDGPRHGFLVGPFPDDHPAALGFVEAARRAAEAADPRAFWYSFGTASVAAPAAPRGVLNDRVGYTPPDGGL